MDIGAILAEADEEVAYDDYEFEKLASPTKHGESVPISVSDILKTSAKVVQKEELEEVDRVLNNSSAFIRDELDAKNDHHDIDKDDRNTLNAILEAEKEVEELNSPRGNRVQIAEPDKVESESSDPDDEDKDDDVDRDPTLCKELIYACHNGKMNQVEILLRKNVNVAYEDRHGWTAFHWTASKGYLDIMEALITHVRNKGKNVKLHLHKHDRLAGWTPLHVAAVCGQLRIAQLLLEFGVKKKKKDRLGEMPVDVVGKGRHQKALLSLLDPRPKPRDEHESRK